MFTTQHTVSTAATPNSVWALMSDYGNIAIWNTGIRASHLVDESQAFGLGAKRQCNINDSGSQYIREEVIEWEEGKKYTIDIYDGTIPLQKSQATIEVVPNASGSSITMTMRYIPKFGLLGTILNAFLFRPLMKRAARNVSTDLARAAENVSTKA